MKNAKYAKPCTPSSPHFDVLFNTPTHTIFPSSPPLAHTPTHTSPPQHCTHLLPLPYPNPTPSNRIQRLQISILIKRLKPMPPLRNRMHPLPISHPQYLLSVDSPSSSFPTSN